MGILILIPAAGRSSRMQGRDKLLEIVAGRPLLAVMTARALTACSGVLVTLPQEDEARHSCLAEHLEGEVFETCRLDPQEGMSLSLREGAARAAARGLALLVLPADMPEIEAADLRDIMSAHDNAPHKIIRGYGESGRAGHPILFPPSYLAEFAALRGDHGAQAILEAHAADIVALPLRGERACLDLDTPEAWEAWRAKAS